MRTPHFVAVIDGAGDPRGRTWQGRSLGRDAAETLGAAVRRLSPDATPTELVAALTKALSERRDEMARDGLTPPWPAANLVVYSNARRQIIRVGDCAFRVDDQVSNPPPKAFEQTLIDVRRLILHAGLSADLDQHELDGDVRDILQTLYRYQEMCQNTPTPHPYSFPVLDGNPVPLSGIEVVDVPPGRHEIVLASDGYPEVRSSLAESEDALAQVLKTDPLLIGDHAQTKSLRPDDLSYDDRTYVRIAVGGADEDPGTVS
ncbi:hypothetical protein AB0B12_31190 [Streptomyces sp. NPDC044780]|uniref:hypothetical protein n=1 Tax=unclassified Streptomyces TaxID=2593676 RepID=UPI0033D4F233